MFCLFCCLCFSFPLTVLKLLFFLTHIWKKEGQMRNVKNKEKLKTEKELFLCADSQRKNKSKNKHKG